MHTQSVIPWTHEHVFGLDRKSFGEKRTNIVLTLTLITMVIEIVAGYRYGSMALLADGLHMASHSAALAVSALAYRYARRHARDPRFVFGTGKVNSLAAFSSAGLLLFIACAMVLESGKRLMWPVAIDFTQAILVALLGFLVNGLSLIILGGFHFPERPSPGLPPPAPHPRPGRFADKDHNLLSATLHVLADALTSLLAIAALSAAKYLRLPLLDPLIGLLGAGLVIRWAYRLIRVSSAVLLDMQAPEHLREEIRRHLESIADVRLADVHVWAIGPGLYAAAITVVSSYPLDPQQLRERLAAQHELAHVTIEVARCPCPTHSSGTSSP